MVDNITKPIWTTPLRYLKHLNKMTTEVVGNIGHSLGQAQKCDGFNLSWKESWTVIGHHILPIST